MRNKILDVTKDEEVLTREEREFAEKWHNTVYAFLHSRKLSIEEYYDVVIFDYLRAVRNYNRQKRLQQYSFHTISWRCMDSARCNYQNSMDRKQKYYTEISMDEIRTESGESLLDVMEADEQLREAHEYIEDMAKYLTTKQLEQLKHMYCGYTQEECIKILKIPKDRERENRKIIRKAMEAVMME